MFHLDDHDRNNNNDITTIEARACTFGPGQNVGSSPLFLLTFLSF